MREHWKSLEELSDSPELRERLSREFPEYEPEEIQSLSRRKFMKIMAASMAMAGLTLTGCRRWPKEELAPYSSNPRDRVPGVPEQFATVYDIGGVGHGLLVTSYDGRPIKVEGNPSHPFASTFDGKLGASDAFAQASVLELYDPDRSRSIRRAGQEVEWSAFADVIRAVQGTNGTGLAILSEASGSPSVVGMRRRLLDKYPQARWYEYEPVVQTREKLASANAVRTRLHLEKADTVVLLDADILGSHPAHIRYSNDWAKRRRSADQADGGMIRMYVAESCFSLSGAAADERIGVVPSRVAVLAMALAARVGVNGVTAPAALSDAENAFIERVARDVRTNGVVVAGPDLSPDVHAIVHNINTTLGVYGKTVSLLQEPEAPRESIARLVEHISAGSVSTLLIVGGNPVFDAPPGLGFVEAIGKVATTVHLSLYHDETSAKCTWHIPRAHYLESWGDARAWDGTVSLQQPLILPLYNGKSAIELLASFVGDGVIDGRAIVQRTFSELTGNHQEAAFRRVLHDGVLPDSQFQAITLPVQPINAPAPITTSSPGTMEIRFIADQKVLDGRFANSGWLQELPETMTKLTWDNAALLSKTDADGLQVKTGDVVRLSVGETSIEIAAYVLPGQPVGVTGLPLGYGRTSSGNVGNGVGVNVYPIRTTGAVQIARTGKTYPLAATQEHHLIDAIGFKGRQNRVGEKGKSGSIVREATFAEYQRDPYFARETGHVVVSLPILQQPSEFRTPHAWGMAIDMSACTGCNACVVACQAENNIPVVGKDEVIRNREMHWLRIDRYYKGEPDDPNPDVVYQPMMCVHCENAPCEQVCPVAATVHDTEGLNTMVYNRCIGTRYCANNCPYKVRRFNYFDWHSKDPRGAAQPWLGMPDSQQQQVIDRIKRMIFNPEVTVRMRGVMEKCTYCVQRIHTTQTAKRNAGQELQDGDVVSACQQACPTEAIVFGNVNDPNSKVRQMHQNRRAYSVLEELNTKPRTMHLAKLRNRT